MTVLKAGVAAATTVAIVGFAVVPARRGVAGAFAPPRPSPEWAVDAAHATEARADALRRAKVWTANNPAAANLASNPPDPAGTLSTPVVECRFLPRPPHGTTTKFDCVLRNGEVVKVKYGFTGEIQSEVAATRLLSALGFGADRMYVVPTVRCYGCPRQPFYSVWAANAVHAMRLFERALPLNGYTDFKWAAVERKFPGASIEVGDTTGWAWYELDDADASYGGATQAEKDAFRLVALLIAHWDNKAANQRLVCRGMNLARGSAAAAAPADSPSEAESYTSCESVVALIQDLGASFGPNKVDLDAWTRAPIWADARACRVSMKSFPYGGSTFPDGAISEDGRQLLLGQLHKLDERQLVSLFEGARFQQHASGRHGDPRAWAHAFAERVHTIENAGPCPPATN
jgi:hypothetical protein